MRPRLDHVELFVPQREAAAEWYQQVLDLTAVAAAADWATDPEGPLMISGDGGDTKLALFRGKRPGGGSGAGFFRVAFRVEGREFLTFVERLERLGIGEAGARPRVVDHDLSFSVYFTDPYGHRLEVTTYDHLLVRSSRQAAAGGTGGSAA